MPDTSGSFFVDSDLFIILAQMKINRQALVSEAKLKGRVRRCAPVAPLLPQCWVAFGGQVEIMGDDEAGTYCETPRQLGFYQRSRRPCALVA